MDLGKKMLYLLVHGSGIILSGRKRNHHVVTDTATHYLRTHTYYGFAHILPQTGFNCDHESTYSALACTYGFRRLIVDLGISVTSPPFVSVH